MYKYQNLKKYQYLNLIFRILIRKIGSLKDKHLYESDIIRKKS